MNIRITPEAVGQSVVAQLESAGLTVLQRAPIPWFPSPAQHIAFGADTGIDAREPSFIEGCMHIPLLLVMDVLGKHDASRYPDCPGHAWSERFAPYFVQDAYLTCGKARPPGHYRLAVHPEAWCFLAQHPCVKCVRSYGPTNRQHTQRVTYLDDRGHQAVLCQWPYDESHMLWVPHETNIPPGVMDYYAKK